MQKKSNSIKKAKSRLMISMKSYKRRLGGTMEKRRAGEIPTLETRANANETIDRQKRYKQIIECLQQVGDIGLTAKECAVLMNEKGYIPTSERNFTAPRLTEMSQKGIVEPYGKTRCAYTGKKVAVYRLCEVV